MSGLGQKQQQNQSQKQTQRMSQLQIQAVSYLAMSSKDLREEIYKTASENPAIEIVYDPLTASPAEIENKLRKNARSQGNQNLEQYSSRTTQTGTEAANSNQGMIEGLESRKETLQQHLMDQLNLTKLSPDEYDLSQKLIYNLDKNGCYGSMLAPDTLLDKKRPLQTKQMLEKCIDRIQRMDPIGTCCKNPEESLFIQAKISESASPLTLFILDGRLDLLSPPHTDKVLHKLIEYQKQWHSKKFAPHIVLDELNLTEELVQTSIQEILSLNPRPAGEYISDVSQADFSKPEIVLSVKKIMGSSHSDDFSQGIVSGGSNFYFQVTYANGELPEIRIAADYKFDKELIKKAQNYINLLEFRQSTLILQGCAIVSKQNQFFSSGPGNLQPLTRRQIAQELGIHESTVSRVSGKKTSKYIETEWGLYPFDYFFVSGVESTDGSSQVSAETIKVLMLQIIEKNKSDKPLSDSRLTTLLNDQGIAVSRRTVNKYRAQLGINNSYNR